MLSGEIGVGVGVGVSVGVGDGVADGVAVAGGSGVSVGAGDAGGAARVGARLTAATVGCAGAGVGSRPPQAASTNPKTIKTTLSGRMRFARLAVIVARFMGAMIAQVDLWFG
jgi:hypothetical protein